MNESLSIQELSDLRSMIDQQERTGRIKSLQISELNGYMENYLRQIAAYIGINYTVDDETMRLLVQNVFKYYGSWYIGELGIVFSRTMAGYYPISSKLTGKEIGNMFWSYRKDRRDAMSFRTISNMTEDNEPMFRRGAGISLCLQVLDTLAAEQGVEKITDEFIAENYEELSRRIEKNSKKINL